MRAELSFLKLMRPGGCITMHLDAAAGDASVEFSCVSSSELNWYTFIEVSFNDDFVSSQ